ncbi:IPT/TIG domain-containing protein [Chloroflexota bacterium]
MAKNKIFRTLALALTLALLVTALPATPALAAETLYVYPTSGEIGEEFEVWGNEFSSGFDYDIYFSDERAFVNDEIDEDVLNYEFLGTVAIDSGETYFTDARYDVPSQLRDGDEDEKVRGGTYYIYATYEDDERIKARVEFDVEAVAIISLDSNEGTVGTEVEISGEGYGDSEDITVEYDGSDVDIESGDSDTDSSGEFECTILVPESTAGDHTITVIGDDSDLEAEDTFTVEPQISISPESGAAGDTVTVSGTGFGDEVDIAITFNTTEVATDETDDDGSFEVSFNVPALGAGSYDIEADDDDNSDTAEFTIATATFNLSSTTGSVGDVVTVSGTGFQASKSITITFDNESAATATTDVDGAFSADVTVPVRTADTYKVKASDGTNTIEADFSISTSAGISPVTSVASPGYVDSQLTVSGIGFVAGRTVTITYDGSQVATSLVKTDGTFSATFNVPASSGGEHSIIATDGVNTKPLTFIMESSPPSTVYPQLPLMDSKLEEWRLDWCGDATDLTKEVTDASPPITYTLQIATSEDFSEDSIVLEKTGLTESECTLDKEERLESVDEESPYYWHVKAVDGAANEGPWTGTGRFYVGFSFGLSQTVIYILIGIGALLLGIFGFWLGRKTAYY